MEDELISKGVGFWRGQGAYHDSATGVLHQQGVRSGDRQVIISW